MNETDASMHITQELDSEIDGDRTEEVPDRSSILRRKYEDTGVETLKIAKKKAAQLDATEVTDKEQKTATTA
jgi:hypothetical protein